MKIKFKECATDKLLMEVESDYVPPVTSVISIDNEWYAVSHSRIDYRHLKVGVEITGIVEVKRI